MVPTSSLNSGIASLVMANAGGLLSDEVSHGKGFVSNTSESFCDWAWWKAPVDVYNLFRLGLNGPAGKGEDFR